ncbi:MAG: DUF1554 domain-containing protein [Proteobacteria bacterium]|nr:MAG: DUF1554 domain-containing protein [Pseudomonadota bacterium]
MDDKNFETRLTFRHLSDRETSSGRSVKKAAPPMKKYLCLATGALALSLTLSACGVELGYPGGPDGTASNGQKGEGQRIFMTSDSFTGDLGGPEGADAHCNNDANTPKDGTYKALLASTNRSPIAFLKANAQYIRPDGTLVAKTNINKVFTSYSNAISGTSALVWTGITREFAASSSHCNNWTDAVQTTLGQAGLGNAASSNAMANALQGIGCNVQHRLYCVEI